MNYKMMKVSDVVKSPYNPRIDLTPADPAFKKIASSLSEFGCVEPIVVNEHNNRCVGGHQRLSVMRYLGYEEVPCVLINEPDEMKEKALNIALNKIDNKFDETKLFELIKELESLDIDLGLTGFNTLEIEQLLAEVDTEVDTEVEEAEEEEEVGELSEAGVVAKIGTYHFYVERQQYIDTINEIRLIAGFNDNDIIAELKRRLRND